MQEGEAPKPLTVSQAASLVQKHLESIRLTIEGEVSQVTDKRGYSAVYFTVKDEGASLECKMWMNRYEKTGFALKVGMLVRLTGRFTYYGAGGKFSFDVFDLQLSGEGSLRMKVAQIAERLRLEGLMDPQKKRPIPAYPQRIGLVTSPRGAAVRDVLRTLRRRYPIAEVLVCGVPVEGKGAPEYIIQGLVDAVNGGAEVILLVRGGGSFENLMPFNDEKLARTVARCPVPIITGIGHEPDNSICDMVADHRASTPTAAAEAVAPDMSSIYAALDQCGNRMNRFFSHKLDVTRVYLDIIAQRPIFEDPNALFASYGLALDSLQDRLSRSVTDVMDKESIKLDALELRLHAAIPGNIERDSAQIQSLETRLVGSISSQMQQYESTLKALEKRLVVSGSNMLSPFEHQISLKAARLNDLSPLAVLGRGYSITRTEQGSIVRNTDQVAPGSHVAVTVADGVLGCTVDTVSNEK